jgi:hypothetical protein
LELHFLRSNDASEPEKAAMISLVSILVLQGTPPRLGICLMLKYAQVIHEGARLRARLPAYLAQRSALLDAHCPLIAPLKDLVSSYAVPTTEDLWATGLGLEE